MAQHVQCEWRGLTAIHRFEDLSLIAEVLVARRPRRVVELGTAGGGFAAFLADTVRPWDGKVLTVDWKLDAEVAERLRALCPNVVTLQADCLASRNSLCLEWLDLEGAALYADDGNKMRELELYVPAMANGGLVGTHDYGTEVDPEWAEGFMALHGWAPYRHADFEALAHPEWYPVSYTRFWIKGIPG